MKKIIVTCIIFSVVVMACHKKAMPAGTTINGVTYTQADATAGKLLYETKCIKCHKAKDTELYTLEKWPGILKSMVPKAKLNEEETRQVTAYVMTHAKKAS
jgi:mono/diheme cytochrome c family protein